jgi:hypothetical protein
MQSHRNLQQHISSLRCIILSITIAAIPCFDHATKFIRKYLHADQFTRPPKITAGKPLLWREDGDTYCGAPLRALATVKKNLKYKRRPEVGDPSTPLFKNCGLAQNCVP